MPNRPSPLSIHCSWKHSWGLRRMCCPPLGSNHAAACMERCIPLLELAPSISAPPLYPLQLEAQLGAAEDALSSLGELLQGAIKRLVEAGQLPASATEAVLSACLMGRLNPHAFPGTPQVSPHFLFLFLLLPLSELALRPAMHHEIHVCTGITCHSRRSM